MPKNVTAQQRQAISYLITGHSITDTAQKLNLSRKTISSWVNSPAFQAELRQAESELMAELNRQLLGVGKQAVDTLAGVLDSPESQALAIRAADSVLGKLLAIRQLTELEQRLAALEMRMKNETE